MLDKAQFFPYRHAIDLTISLTHGIPLQTDNPEKAHARSEALLLKREQAPCPFSQSSWLQENKNALCQGKARRGTSELIFLMVHSNQKEWR